MARKRYKPEEIVAAAAGRRRSAAKTSMLNVADQLAKGVGILKVARSLGIQSRRNSNVAQGLFGEPCQIHLRPQTTSMSAIIAAFVSGLERRRWAGIVGTIPDLSEPASSPLPYTAGVSRGSRLLV